MVYALFEKTETELDRLVKEGTIEPVKFSEWATPMVPIVKEDGTIKNLWRLQANDSSSSQARQTPRP